MDRIFLLAFLMLLILHPSSAQAIPPISATVPDLVSAADVIVVGRPAFLEAHMQADPPEVIYSVASDRVLKGDLRFEHRTLVVKSLYHEGTKRAEDYGIYFLRSAENGTFTEAISGYSSVVAIPRKDSTAPNPDPLQAVTEELLAILTAPPAAIENNAQHALPEVLYFEASNAMTTIPATVASAPLEIGLRSNSNIVSRCWIISTLLEMNVPVSLDSVKALLESPSPGMERTQKYVILHIGPFIVPQDWENTLVEFLNSSDVDLRRAATLGLRKIKTERSIRVLAQIALRDGDPEVRANAEQGLCWAMKLITAPCDVAAEQNEEAQHRYWTNWSNSTYH